MRKIKHYLSVPDGHGDQSRLSWFIEYASLMLMVLACTIAKKQGDRQTIDRILAGVDVMAEVEQNDFLREDFERDIQEHIATCTNPECGVKGRDIDDLLAEAQARFSSFGLN